MNPSIAMCENACRHSPQALGKMETPWSLKDKIGNFHANEHRIKEALNMAAILIDNLGTQFDKNFGDVDFDRTHFVACAAQRRCVRQRLRMPHLLELRGEDGSNRTGVDGAVCVSAGLAIHRTCIHAGGAADALEGLALSGPGENRRAAVVEQNNIKTLRAIVRRNAGPQRGIGVHALPGGRTRKHLEHDFEVAIARQNLFDASQCNHGARQGETHPAVAF